MSVRPRRLRSSDAMRRLVRETRLSVDQLVMPLFVRPGQHVRTPIPSMPGQFRFSVEQAVNECQELQQLRVPAVLLFGSPQKKDDKASSACAKDGIVQQAVRAIKAKVPNLLIMTDVCLCAFTSHGHCGIVNTVHSSTLKVQGQKEKMWAVDNDATLSVLAKIAVSHAQAGADLVAPSAMMDGQVGAIRAALDAAEFERVPIMSYAAKFASSFYGPFREAVESTPAFGDRKTYQMDPANAEEAIREVELDLQEGADIVMVKPALAYLDVIRRIKDRFPHPLAAYNVSGEYAMVKAAASRGWLIERAAWLETLLAIRRAGADILITYHAKEIAQWLKT